VIILESVVIKLKKLKKSELADTHFVPKDRELIVEEDVKDSDDKSVYRFKVGDGMRPYSDLPYVSSLYSLFPNVLLCDTNYTRSIELQFKE
jgi:hypothetical protein